MSLTFDQTQRAPTDTAKPPIPPLFDNIGSIDALRLEAEGYVARAFTMMSRARNVVQSDHSAMISVLNGRRLQLGAHFGRYQAFKHGQIFDPVIEFGSASSRVVARAMKVDCMALGEEFGAYQSRWLGLGQNDWTSYRRDMLATVETLTSHLEAELRAMRQLILISRMHCA